MFHLSKIVDATTKGSLKGTKLNVAVRTQKTKQKRKKQKKKRKKVTILHLATKEIRENQAEIS